MEMVTEYVVEFQRRTQADRRMKHDPNVRIKWDSDCSFDTLAEAQADVKVYQDMISKGQMEQLGMRIRKIVTGTEIVQVVHPETPTDAYGKEIDNTPLTV